MKTQGEVEAAICEGITRFEQEYMGRGPKHIHTHLSRSTRLTKAAAGPTSRSGSIRAI
jgi:uncharacterized protein YbcI